ncbi:flagellar assembly protein A [Clostridium sp. HMP27]|nr:flagellar assembly protein A [Clostridium sp. HMP27]
METITNISTKTNTATNVSGSVMIKNGEIMVKNPNENDKAACLVIDDSIKVKINGELVKGKVEIYENSVIEIELEDEELPKRYLNISISDDRMNAYISIAYEPKFIYKLKDVEEGNSAILKKVIKDQIMPEKYTVKEIKEELVKKGIICDIIEENIAKYVEEGCEKVLIAKGIYPVDEEDDYMEYKFSVSDDHVNFQEDKNGNIDFKSIGNIKSIEKGSVIAIKHLGKPGHDGKDVMGKVKKHKSGKKIKLKLGNGCAIKDDNIIIATIEGKPCVKGNTICVYSMHQIKSDVDLETGDIKFVGDIDILGSVKEGMKVEAGNSITVHKDIYRASIIAKGDIYIRGNAVSSTIFAGGVNVDKLQYSKTLNALKSMLNDIINNIGEIKKFNILGNARKDGEILKALIETKFKNLNRVCLNIISHIKLIGDVKGQEELIPLMKHKLMGLAPINVKHYSELDLITKCIDSITREMDGALILPVNINLAYLQDSRIKSTGDVIITGKGQYVSEIIANGSIYFIGQKAVSRGGVLKAQNEIKCKVVGSEGGVKTTLMVERGGSIWCDIAYTNTVYVIGNREVVLNAPSKDIHAYLDDRGELILDKLML